MISYAALEPLLVGLIVATSGGFALCRFAPRQLRRLGELARGAGLPGWLADLPGKPMDVSIGCANGCSSCSSNCGPTPNQNKQVVVVHHHKATTPPEDRLPT